MNPIRTALNLLQERTTVGRLAAAEALEDEYRKHPTESRWELARIANLIKPCRQYLDAEVALVIYLEKLELDAESEVAAYRDQPPADEPIGTVASMAVDALTVA